MSVSSWIRRQFANGVITTAQLNGTLASGTTTTFSVGSGQGATFPDGSVGPFSVTVCLINSALQTSNEERILCASRSGDVFTIASGGRGYNGYTALTHASGEAVLHTADQQDFDEANQVAHQTLGAITASGDLLVGSSANTLTKLARGAANSFLQTVGTTLQWTPFGSGGTTAIASAGADGTSPDPARYDHTHAGVASFNTRQGAVTPGNADYLAVASGGLTGATTAARFVGGTTGGAPASGTFAVGDYVVDQKGQIWVCTTAGSPGTWTLPYPALTTASGHLASNYTLTTSLATFLTTGSLAVGTWLVTCTGLVGTGAQIVELTTAIGTATATFDGAYSAEVYGGATAGSPFDTFSMSFVATVTVAGTLVFKAIVNNVTNTPIIAAATGTNSYTNATGYTAVRVA